MPLCAAFHEIVQKPNGYAILQFSGREHVLTRIAGSRYTVPEEKLALIEAIRGRVLIDLSPVLDECYALGPYKLRDNRDELIDAPYGKAIGAAKYGKQNNAVDWLRKESSEFALAYAQQRRIDTVVTTPRRYPGLIGLGEQMARSIASALGTKLVQATFTRSTEEQKSRPEGATEADMMGRIKGTMLIGESLHDQRVLLVDDVLGSGGTMTELGRAAKAAGASWAAGLCGAKLARDMRGGVDLLAELWR